MHEKGIHPSSVTLGCMVEALVNCSVVEEAAKLVSRWMVLTCSDGSHLTVGLKGSLNGGHCVGVIRPDANLW